jgi:hypothetical protein
MGWWWHSGRIGGVVAGNIETTHSWVLPRTADTLGETFMQWSINPDTTLGFSSARAGARPPLK